MKMKKIEINNTKSSNYLYYLILTYLIVFMILPTFILTNLENSLVAVFLNNNLYIVTEKFLFGIHRERVIGKSVNKALELLMNQTI